MNKRSANTVGLHVQKEKTYTRGRYVACMDGVEGEVEIRFTQRSQNLISADHVGAAPALRGSGAAKALVEYVVADARANNFEVVAICPYFRKLLERHPQWGDVVYAEN